MKIRVPVEKLESGMYVAELDRAWIGTPFLFQGFLIEGEEELAQLRDCCKFVYVDDLQSSQESRVQNRLREMISGTHSGKVSKITVEFETWQGLDKLRATLSKLDDKRTVAVTRLHELAQNAGNLSREQINETRSSVSGLIDEVSNDPKTSFWMTLLSEKDEAMGSHAVNVSVLAVGFAAYLGWDAEQQNIVGQGAMLHDIGMTRVPAWLINKPSRLTPQEFKLVQKHAALGAQLLGDIGGMDARIIEIIRHHHERPDGHGYPDGLTGEQIPEAVKLVRICDAYDSLTQDQPYRPGADSATALQKLMLAGEKEFDGQMVEAFIRWMGIYPLGSLVRLRNAYTGIVISSDPVRRLRPVVLLVKTPDKKNVWPRKTVNLEMLAHSPLGKDWAVESILDPRNAGIDVRRILLEEFQFAKTPRAGAA